MPTTYQALQIFRHATSAAAAVRVVELPEQAPGPGEVLVENHYAGVNGIYDYGLISGAVGRPDAELPFCFGFESVGRVIALGTGVSELTVGQAVASVGFGRAYREQFIAPATDLVAIDEPSPAVLTLIPTGASAWLAVTATGELKTGDRVLVSAAAGGFGHIAVQVARPEASLLVGITGAAAKAARLASLNVDHVINHRDDDLDAALTRYFPDGIDLVIDTVGGAVFDAAVRHLAPHARLVSAGFSADAAAPEAVLRPRIYTELYWKAASVRAFMNPLFDDRQPEARAALFARLARGDLDVWTHTPYFRGLDAVADAINCLRAGKNTGKVVIELPAARR